MNDAEKIEQIKKILADYAKMPPGDNLQEGVMAVLTLANIAGVAHG